jgi:hypothetical protein
VSKKFDKLGEKYPFLSLVSYAGSEYIGIIQNFDKNCLSIYDIDQIKDPKLLKVFLELGEQWWWESNRKIPINIFLKNEFTIFKPCLRTLISKDCEVVSGPQVSLKSIMEKRVKKRSIQLVKKPS